MKLFSTVIFYWDWIKNTQEICQWKSLNLDQLSYAERSREHLIYIRIYSKAEDYETENKMCVDTEYAREDYETENKKRVDTEYTWEKMSAAWI